MKLNISKPTSGHHLSSTSDRYLLLGWLRIVLFIAGLLACLGCEHQAGPTPPHIALGQQECDLCRMIISDDRYAAALIIDEQGEYSSLVFDDIGCLIQHERAEKSLTIAARYVCDQQSRQWLNCATAAYLHSDRIESPMASGVAALADRANALSLQLEFGGDICDFNEIQRRSAAGKLAVDFAPDHGRVP